MSEKIKIFIVEDNEVYTMMLNEQLKGVLSDYYLTEFSSLDYSLITFTSGKECIKNLHLNPDVIILDYYLEAENGLDVLKAIKKENPKIPVMILSKEKDLHIVKKLMDEGAANYIIKEQGDYIEVKNAIFKILKYLEDKKAAIKSNFRKSITWMAVWTIIVVALCVITVSLFLKN